MAASTANPMHSAGVSLVRVLLLGALLTCLAYAAWMGTRLAGDPTVSFLRDREGAAWILHDSPPELATRPLGAVVCRFRTHISLPGKSAAAELEILAMTRARVLLDGKLVLQPEPGPTNWKEPIRVSLGSAAEPRRQSLMVEVENPAGPPALWVHGGALGIATDASWESSVDGISWQRVRLAADRPIPPVAREFPSPGTALSRHATTFALLFAAVFGLTRALARRRTPWTPSLWPRLARGGALTAWCLLGAHNLPRLPLPTGFDLVGHLDYINFISSRGALPLATDGWQMFQSPLYYSLSAALLRVAVNVVEPTNVLFLLRIIPLACGLAQIELAYRALRRVFPQRPDLQAYGTLFAALVPMNLYLSQYLGNEPLAATLGAAVFTLSLRLLRPAPGEDNRWTPASLGLVLGLALLAKVSAALMAAPVLLAVLLASSTDSRLRACAWRLALKRGGIVLGVAALVAGWYYVRNYLRIGRPFIGGWDPAGGNAWWQEPGFRMPVDFGAFGTCLVHPVAASFGGFLDGIYATFWSDSMLSSATTVASAPPWRHDFQAASLVLALAPTAVLFLGAGIAARAVWRENSAVWLVCLSTIGIYGLALLHHVLTVPYYCAIKAFYTLGAMPAYVLVLAAGAQWVVRAPIRRAFAHGLFACWAVAVYAGFLATG